MEKLLFKSKLLLIFLCLSVGNIRLNAEELDWARSMGSSSVDNSNDVAVDKEGNTYVVGTFYGTVDFNPGAGIDTLGVAGGSDVFLAKYDVSGNYVWAIRVGGIRAEEGKAVAVDGDGNVYITGFFVFQASFNGGVDTLKAGAGFQDIFVAKYDAKGNYKWAINMGGSKINYGLDIAVSAKGNVYITGAFSGTTDFDPGKDIANLTAQPGGFFGGNDYDVFMAKYDSNGKYIWAKCMGSSNADDYGYGIAVDSSENAYITGYFGNIADFDPGSAVSNLISMGPVAMVHDVFVAKYDADGGYLWANSMGGKADDNGLGIALDQASNVYITGYFSDTAIFDPWGAATDTLVSAGRKRADVSYSDYDMFLAKYDAAGKYIWAKTLGSKFEDIGYAIAVDRVGNIFVTGTFSDTAVFDPWGAATNKLVSVGGQTYATSRLDAFLAKYDPDGNHMWSGNIGNSYTNIYGLGITCDDKGNTYATGQFNDTADLDPGAKTANFKAVGSSDIFLLKLICNDTSSSLLEVTTCEESYTLNEEVYRVSGTYKQVFPNAAGCDSTVALELTFSKPEEPVITINKFTLGVSGTYASYQWMENDLLIPGATESTYLVAKNGDYRVIVSNEHGCIDTSDLYKVTNVAIEDINRLAEQILIFPNPSNGVVHISAPFEVNLSLCSIDGKELKQFQKQNQVTLQDIAEGIYFLRVYDPAGRLIKVEKIIKMQ